MNTQIDIEDPSIHLAIAQKVCGWEWTVRPVGKGAHGGPPYFVEAFWVKQNGPHSGSAKKFDELTPFLDANARELAIDDARLNGYFIQTPAGKYGYAAEVNDGNALVPMGVFQSRQEAEIEVLYYIANRLTDTNGKSENSV